MSTSLGNAYLESVIKRLTTYKMLGEGTFMQLEEKDFYYAPNEASNSIAIIIRHLSGNMISRWTNFLTEDGEKPGRNRETEFGLQGEHYTRDQLIEQWNKGWDCLLDTLRTMRLTGPHRTIAKAVYRGRSKAAALVAQQTRP